ncbi:Uu.00g081200.m01.CDS01 [Anthostomella pinea]|uniref:Uu.00g081200.m01.CDS01 n=1 Tax=Anthostomella pinea TaxID=933095 RepID=A0AAI8VL61_9PEZI|nr:Uu.00g081200.m01.CDS01 [Anthostomella pinea]
MTGCFKHARLRSSTSTRVLDLLPSEDFESQLQCLIREVDLEGPDAAYEAVSYVWGSPVGELPILCNEQELLVTPNCRDALLYLRQHSRTRTLWIDSICIDQTTEEASTQERNHQVRMMGRIYSKAQIVLIWLGVGDASTPSIFQAIESGAMDEKAAEKEEALKKILSNPWFIRSWTIQEVVVSPDYAAVSEWAGINDPEDLCSLEDFYSWELELLASLRDGQCMKPHDKIYSMYSILKELGICLESPDYDKPVIEVFEDTAIAYIRSRKRLGILTILPVLDETTGFPSWVPDWSTSRANTRELEVNLVFRNHSATYHATAKSEAIVSQPLTPGSLSLKGMLLGKIVQVEAPSLLRDPFERDQAVAKKRDFIRTYQHWCRVVDSLESYPTHDSLISAFASMLSSQGQTQEFPGMEDFLLWLWYETMLHPNRGHVTAEAATREVDAGYAGYAGSADPGDFAYSIMYGNAHENESIAAKVRTVLLHLYEHHITYTFLLLDTGYFGLGPNGTCWQGDDVYLLAGASSPLALRPQGDNFRLVGCAYVQGVMDGELWPESEDGLEEVTLV